MARVRDYWLEMLSTGVTVMLVGVVYTVLAGYAAGPSFGDQQVSAVRQSGQTHTLAASALH